MQELLTVANLLNAILIVSIWAVKSELRHIRENIEDAQTAADKAHSRIDLILNKH